MDTRRKPASPSAEPLMECRQVVAHGEVQGVGFRASCVQHARGHGITGWVRNRVDGTVEAVLQGPTPDLAEMCEWLRRKVPGARVDALEVRVLPVPFEHYDQFSQRPTV